MHWADVVAADLDKRGGSAVLATAITPSGPIHVGNMREVLTTEMVHRAALARGLDAELLYIGDTYDPLRKVYPFLDKATYEPHVGKPLSEIPCPGPDGKASACHANYAEHFLEPFLAALEDLGVRPRVLHAHRMYEDGAYLEATKRAMQHAGAIRDIMVRVAKREGKLPTNWIPFNVQCERCRRIMGPVPTLYEEPFIEYECKGCGHEGTKDIRVAGGGKLPWRVDWPARWWFLDVTFEAMGKDHAAAGSSWDTGSEIVRIVYGREPPLHAVYEFIQLKGIGAMHSSTGTAVSASDMLRMTPPEVLRFLIARPQPGTHIDFDPGVGVIDLVDEFDRWEEAFFAGEESAERKELVRVYELSQPREVPARQPPRVPYKHLVGLVRRFGSVDRIVASLGESGLVKDLTADERQHLEARIARARFWLDRFAPPEERMLLWADPTPEDLRRGLSAVQTRFLGALADALEGAAWNGDAVQDAIRATAKATEIPPRDAFAALYWVLLGKAQGPKAGDLMADQPKDAILARLRAAA